MTKDGSLSAHFEHTVAVTETGCRVLTLRDQVADISVPLTCPRTVVDAMASPVVEGASVVVLAKPYYYANRGTFSLAVREIRMVGLGELLARLEQRRQLADRNGIIPHIGRYDFRRHLDDVQICWGIGHRLAHSWSFL